jgi:lysophospholipase L1-like esterase
MLNLSKVWSIAGSIFWIIFPTPSTLVWAQIKRPTDFRRIFLTISLREASSSRASLIISFSLLGLCDISVFCRALHISTRSPSYCAVNLGFYQLSCELARGYVNQEGVVLKIFLILILALVVYLIYLAYPVYMALKRADGVVESNHPYEQHPANPTMRILVAGDSSAIGVGAIDPAKSIAGRLGRRYSNADLTNIGVSGAKVNDLLNALQKQKDHHYDLLILQIGANDITHFISLESIKADMAEVLKISNQISDKTIVLTSGDLGRIPIFKWPINVLMTQRTKAVRQIFLEEIAKHPNMSYVDLFYLLKKDPSRKNFDPYYSPDQFHLNDNGYGIYYHYLEEKL